MVKTTKKKYDRQGTQIYLHATGTETHMASLDKTVSTLPYDITKATSIFEYSKGLLGKTLRDFVWEGYETKKGKGSLGQMVENIFFLLETNNYSGADFSEAGMELKCTPLKKSKQDDYLIKERLVPTVFRYIL